MKFYTRRRVSPVITIVSLVDILTMVLMFFVYTTTFKTQQAQVEIVLPKVQNQNVKAVENTPAILTISEKGYGKRTSSFEYRITGRGGKGIGAMAVNARNGNLVASFPVEHGDGIMLVTNGGQLIRCPVDGIRIAGRNTQGVIVFDTAKSEKVVSVDRIAEVGENGNGENGSPESGDAGGQDDGGQDDGGSET